MNNALDRAMNASAAISVRQARFFFAGFYSYAYFYFFSKELYIYLCTKIFNVFSFFVSFFSYHMINMCYI